MTKTCLYATVTFCSILILLGVILAFVDKEQALISILSEKISLKNGTGAMKTWKVTPFPILFKVYFWNVTNPVEVIEGAKPKLAEVGPYVYEQWLEKVNVREEDNDTLSYNPTSRMEFNGGLSGNLNERDLVTVINLPIVGIALTVSEVMPQYMSFLEGVWTSLFPDMKDIFLRVTVRDLLFDGIPIDCNSKDFMVTTVCNNLDGNLPRTIRKVGNKNYRFSFFNYKIQVSSDVLRVYRGIKDFGKLGQIYSFNGAASVKKWDNQYCDMVNGSDGSQMPSNLSPTETIYLFQPDLCRSLYARYEKSIYKGRIKLLRFINTQDLFASPEENPDNECFCAPKVDISEFLGGGEEKENGTESDAPAPKTCVKTGGMILTPCLGAPIVATFPHFYMGDKSYLDYVNLNPKKELHETFVEVEPFLLDLYVLIQTVLPGERFYHGSLAAAFKNLISGTPFLAKKRVQFNIEVKAIPDMSFMENFAPGLLPVLWVEESLQLPEEYSSELETLLIAAGYVNILGYAMIGIGSIALIIIGLHQSKKNKTLSWELDSHPEPKQEYNGLYSNRYKFQFNNENIQLYKNHLGPNYPVLNRKNIRVFPNSNISSPYSENFM